MKTDTKAFHLQPIIDFSDKLEKDNEIIAASIDQDGINVLVIHAAPQYRTQNGMFAVIQSDKPKDYSFIRFDLNGNETVRTLIQHEFYNFHEVNFLPSPEILLVCGRSRYKSEDEFDKNARVYSRKGALVRDFVVGDGIQHVKIDLEGNIWTSYYDEGIFGNYGWDNPIGTPGLICWYKYGKKLWEFVATDGLDDMADCYAMNIDADNNTWFYYYTEFPLVRLDKSRQIKFWETEIAGANSLNILENKILMGGGYDDNHFILFETIGNKLTKRKEIQFTNEEHEALTKRDYIPSFGSRIGFLSNNKIYVTDMSELM